MRAQTLINLAVFKTKIVARFSPLSGGSGRSTAPRITSIAPSTRSSSVPSRSVAFPLRRNPPTVLIRVGPGYPAATSASITFVASASDTIATASFTESIVASRNLRISPARTRVR